MNIRPLTLIVLLTTAQAQQADFMAFGKPVDLQAPDPKIAEILAQVSQANIRKTVETLVGFGSRNTLQGTADHNSGLAHAADWIEAQFNAYSDACRGCLEVKRETWTEPTSRRVPKPIQMTDVYAILRGSDPAQAARINLVTGHYDSRATDVLNPDSPAPGANDDASGVAVSLECARVLSQQKWPSTLVFAAVAGEEQDLLGSRHLAQLGKKEGWQIEGVLNDDIVGGNTTPGEHAQRKSAVRVFSESIPASATPDQLKHLLNRGLVNDSPSRELARAVHAVASSYTAGTPFIAELEYRPDRYLRGGDHSSFNAEGFPAVRLTEWREDYNHQHQDPRTENGIEYGDLIKFVDFAYVTNVARLNAATLAVNASAPAPPSALTLDTKGLDNNSRLTWQAPVGAPPGTVYQLLWRDTAAADWQYAAPVSPDTSITVPVSKDNVIFGVRSLDKAGHASPAAVAE